MFKKSKYVFLSWNECKQNKRRLQEPSIAGEVTWHQEPIRSPGLKRIYVQGLLNVQRRICWSGPNFFSAPSNRRFEKHVHQFEDNSDSSRAFSRVLLCYSSRILLCLVFQVFFHFQFIINKIIKHAEILTGAFVGNGNAVVKLILIFMAKKLIKIWFL